MESTIPKCAHGVYNPDSGKRAFYCGFCSQRLTGQRDKAGFVMPNSHHNSALDTDKLRANKHAVGACPSCGSYIHFDKGADWECAECGETYKSPRNSVRKVELEEVAA